MREDWEAEKEVLNGFITKRVWLDSNNHANFWSKLLPIIFDIEGMKIRKQEREMQNIYF